MDRSKSTKKQGNLKSVENEELRPARKLQPQI
jgi:hypothetical protein